MIHMLKLLSKAFKVVIVTMLCEVREKISWNKGKIEVLREEIENIKINQMKILQIKNVTENFTERTQ